MSAINDGGPAFPIPDLTYPNGQIQYGTPGMSLRDYAVIHFTSAWITSLSTRREEKGYTDEGAAHEAGQLAELQADAMLLAREKGAAQ